MLINRFIFPAAGFGARSALLLAVLTIFTATSQAADDDVLRPEKAYLYTVSTEGSDVLVNWSIQPGYYLYRPKMKFLSRTDGVRLGDAALPPGEPKEDEFFGKTEIYRGGLTVRIPYRAAASAASLRLEIRSQGCADIGLCYPPQIWHADVKLASAPAARSGRELLRGLAGSPLGGSGEEFLPPDQAFRFSSELVDAYTIVARWQIAEGYYLYRDKFEFTAESASIQLGEPIVPRGKSKNDEFFGDVEVFYDNVEIRIPVSRAGPAAGEAELFARYQGCAEDGICYPPIDRSRLMLVPVADTATPAPLSPAPDRGTGPVTEQDRLAGLIANGKLLPVMLTFFGLGLLLAFTPCVLPMIPILSGIIVGQGPNLSAGRGFILSLVYVLAMALTYTVAGVLAALAGQNLQAAFQHPAVIVGFSIIFVLLAAAMFGAYEFQIPAAMQTRLSSVSNRQAGGNLLGVAVMGVLSALIVGPCVAAPLAAALIFIGQSGDAVRGGATLFALSMGMGAPLLAFGAAGGKLLPRAGAWMNTVKAIFGFILLGVAVWMLSRILPGWATLALWAAMAIAIALWLGALGPLLPARGRPAASRLVGLLALAYGALLTLGAAYGGSDPLRPLAGTRFGAYQAHLEFRHIKSVADLERELVAASAAGRPAMLDFYADWCVSCKEMEKYTFTDESVQAALGSAVLLQADVTANDDLDQALLKHFGIFGPPTIAFFDRGGAERRAYRLVGFVPAERFKAHVDNALLEN